MADIEIYSTPATIWQIHCDGVWFQVIDTGSCHQPVQHMVDLDNDGDYDWENIGTIELPDGADIETRIVSYTNYLKEVMCNA